MQPHRVVWYGRIEHHEVSKLTSNIYGATAPQ